MHLNKSNLQTIFKRELPSVALCPLESASLASEKPFVLRSSKIASNISRTLNAQF